MVGAKAKQKQKQVESAGDVLRGRKPEGKDMEFTDRLRRVNEREAPRQPFVFIADEEEKGLGIPDEEVQEQLHTAWLKIGK
ncbi:MAG: hypothetical protein PUB49_06965 [Selenomonadaceae bacterium]|nr:hypothetical protein [Selenomonadaceae bacterium]